MHRSFGIVLAAVIFTLSAEAGPVSRLYLTAGDQYSGFVLQGDSVVASWETTTREQAIMVAETVRTIGTGVGETGREYTLAGTPTGATFPNPGIAAYDGTTDGRYIYAIDFANGNLVRFDLDWTNPVTLFQLPSDDYLAITWDPQTNSLWVGQWTVGRIENYSLDGDLLSAFTVPVDAISCLALDPADGTLWFGSQGTLGTFYQYSRTGVALSTETYPALAAMNTLGGEFALAAALPADVPALDSRALVLLALALGCAGVILVRRA